MHRMYVLLLVRVPIRSIVLGILGHHWTHVLRVVWLIARMRPHMRRYLSVGAVMPPLWWLHGHRLPIRRDVIWIHGEILWQLVPRAVRHSVKNS